jgi:hypothetical protein
MDTRLVILIVLPLRHANRPVTPAGLYSYTLAEVRRRFERRKPHEIGVINRRTTCGT